MVSVKMFGNPNNNFRENVSKFWTAYLGWIQGDKFDSDLVSGDNIDEKYGLVADWKYLYGEYYGDDIPYSIAMYHDADWEDIIAFIELTYHHVILDGKKDKYEAKINEYLKRFSVGYLFSAGTFIKITEIVQEPNVQEILEWIDAYPDAAKAYRAALKKISEKQYARNALDDMRLSIESLVREIMGTTKTLENQIPSVGAALKAKGALPQAITFITTMLTHYAKYQNDNVKHHDTADVEDIEMIVSMTAVMMKYIKDKLG